MALTMPADTGGGTFERCPEGNHVAACSSIIDKGTHLVQYPGQPDKMQRQVFISWEISGEQQEDGSPFYVGKGYTLSSHEKSNLRKDLESWRGIKFTDADFGPGGFELKRVLGVGCMLNVVHTEKDGKTYANIATIARLPKGMQSPPLTEPATYLSLEADEFDVRVFDGLSDKMQEKIRQSPEYQAIVSGEPHVDVRAKPGVQAEEEETPF
jgi:hypothetical protein